MSADDVVRIGGILVEWLSANNYKVGLSFGCKFFSIRPFATSFYSEPFWLVVRPPHKGSQHTIVCDSQITLFFLCSFLRLYLVRSRLFTVLSSVIRLLRKCVLTLVCVCAPNARPGMLAHPTTPITTYARSASKYCWYAVC